MNDKTTLGNNVHFNGISIRGKGAVTIGNNFHSGPEIIIFTENHNYRGDRIPYDNTFIIKDVRIEDNVWLGAKVLILPGVTIGEGAIIQAGAVVVNDIPALGIAGGNPAKVFTYRDENHYQSLKKQGKFF
ncbi:acyltransferase [Balneola sp. MJW-20]|uniref:acyltransferase n=1 Tax=Gracilimonas aurantiaca TaxID=3234185 RepID=UPI0034656FDC